jgi:hypothetical protein
MPSRNSSKKRDAAKTLARFWGVHVADTGVCRGHCAPLDFFTDWLFDRPSLSLVLGARGAGKSFLSALATHLDSIYYNDHGTRVLGGSLAQSEQIYNGLAHFDKVRPGYAAKIHKTFAHYNNGSDVSILAASPTSVRGPHIPTLRLDEVDEIEPDIRESAMGMNMDRGGVRGMTAMTSTWHKIAGPMTELIERGEAGDFPVYRFCSFEVLETCPEERSGPNLEGCQTCPLKTWCHDEGIAESGTPKAKRSRGHYTIDSLIQKSMAVSKRVFESDYLCKGPKADGVWFKGFNPSIHVHENAEYDPALPVHLAVDSGVFTGAVWFQINRTGPVGPTVNVFADYLAENLPVAHDAGAILRITEQRCEGRIDRPTTDPAGGARNATGVTVLSEYANNGLRLGRWPIGPVADGLALIESLVEPAAGPPKILVHPRCRATINAFLSYTRAKRKGQWMDYPEDPQHPHEDVMDALRGGLYDAIPFNRTLKVVRASGTS